MGGVQSQQRASSSVVQFRKLSLQRPPEYIAQSFNSQASNWFIPILSRRGKYDDMCGAMLHIYCNLRLTGDKVSLEVDFPENTLKYALRSCANKVIPIDLTLRTTGLHEQLRSSVPSLFSNYLLEGIPREISHANMILLYRKNGEIVAEHFEPHGTISSTFISPFQGLMLNLPFLSVLKQLLGRIDESYDLLLQQLHRKLEELTLEKVRYLRPIDLCPMKIGPQTRTAKQESTVLSKGYCRSWSLAWVDLRMHNSDLAPEELMRQILLLPDEEIFKFVHDYAFYARKLTEQLSGGDDRYPIIGTTIVSILEQLIPRLEERAGTANAQTIFDSIMRAVGNAPTGTAMASLKVLADFVLVHTPDDWSRAAEIFDAVVGLDFGILGMKTLKDLVSTVDYTYRVDDVLNLLVQKSPVKKRNVKRNVLKNVKSKTIKKTRRR